MRKLNRIGGWALLWAIGNVVACGATAEDRGSAGEQAMPPGFLYVGKANDFSARQE